MELSYQNLNEINVVSDQDVLSVPLWNNENVSRNNMFKPYLYKKGLIVIGNLLQEGKFLSKEDLELSYGISHINFLDYYQLKLDVLTFIKKYTLVTSLCGDENFTFALNRFIIVI